MGAFIKVILGLLVPPDPCPWDLVPGAQDQDKIEEVKRNMRRWFTSIAAVLAGLLVVVAGSFFTPYGFALAGDVAAKNQEAVKPLAESVIEIKKELSDNKAANTQMVAMLNELRAVAVAEGIDRLVRRRCIETDIDELQSLRRDIEAKKVVYFTLARVQYAEPSCAEVRR